LLLMILFNISSSQLKFYHKYISINNGGMLN